MESDLRRGYHSEVGELVKTPVKSPRLARDDSGSATLDVRRAAVPEPPAYHSLRHSTGSRRFALQVGAVGLLGLGTDHLAALRLAVASDDLALQTSPGRLVIFILLSGRLAQHDNFDPKPDAPEAIRGEFRPIATRTPGVHVCEHLPLLAQRSHLWSMVRSPWSRRASR
jgi:hypothetical protein